MAGSEIRVTLLSFFSTVGKTEESLESTEGFRATEQSIQKPTADPPAAVSIPVKHLVSAPVFCDGKKRGDPQGEPVVFPQGLPADAEEQRQFLTEQCIASFHLCLSRFPQHYKSLYRLAFLYTYSKTHRVSGVWEREGRLVSLNIGGQNHDRSELCNGAGRFAWEGWEGESQATVSRRLIPGLSPPAASCRGPLPSSCPSA